jgi:hypothetical protein
MPVEAVIGIDELNRAFTVASREFLRDKRTRLRGLAEPVRADAESMAVSRIPTIGPEWFRMRTGATATASYVAPVKRGTKIPTRKRRRFAQLLLSRAMEPALTKNAPLIQREFDEMLARMERKFNRG